MDYAPNVNHGWWLVPIQEHPHPHFDFMTEVWSWQNSSPVQPCVSGWNSSRTHQNSGLRVTWQGSVLLFCQFEAFVVARASWLILSIDYCLVWSTLPSWQNQSTRLLNTLWAFLHPCCIYLEYSFPLSLQYVHCVSRPRSNIAFSMSPSWLSLKKSIFCTQKELLYIIT